MLNTVRAVVKEGRIELLEKLDLPEGMPLLVTSLVDEPDIWLRVSEPSLAAVWENEEDDVYAELLTK